METLGYRDFREFVEKAQEVSEWRLVEGADWDKEIGALIEVTAELPQPPMLVFDKIKDYPAGFRLVSLPYASYKRVALAFGLPANKSKLEIVRIGRAKDKIGPSPRPGGGQKFAADGERDGGRRG